MNIIDTMISNVDHHNDCREPQYSVSMFYDRSGDGIIVFGCDICCSYTNYQSSKAEIFDILTSKAEIFDILNGTSLKNVSFARIELLTKDQLERRKVNIRPIFEKNGTMSNLSFEIRYRHDDSVDCFDVIFHNGSDEAAQRRFFECAVSEKGIDFSQRLYYAQGVYRAQISYHFEIKDFAEVMTVLDTMSKHEIH